MIRRLAILSCVLALGAAGVSACGEDDSSEPVADIDVARVAAATEAKRSAEYRMTMTMSGMGLPRPLKLDAGGATDLTRARMVLRLDLSDLADGIGVPSELLGEDQTVEMRLDGGQLYVRVPEIPLLSRRLDGKRWISANLKELAPALGIDAEGFGALFSFDPASQLRSLKAIKGLENEGTETFDGVKVTRYKGSFSARDALNALPAAKREAALEAFESTARLAPDVDADEFLDQEQGSELWIDEDGLVRQLRTEGETPGAQGLPGGQFAMNFRLTRFGVDVDVTPPPAAETYEVTAEALKSVLPRAAAATS